MPIYDMYPYTNLHELNLDWIIKVAKETQDALADITTLVSDLSDLSDCLHAYPNFSPNPRLVCDYDLVVSGDIRASGHTVYTKDVIATGNISCDNMTASGDLTVSGTINGDLNGTAAKAGMARALCDSTWAAYNNIGASDKPIYWYLGAPTACGNSLAVDITGNAATATSAISASSATTAQNATQLKQARNFTLTGAVSGTVSSDLATDLSIATTQNIIKKVRCTISPLTDYHSWQYANYDVGCFFFGSNTNNVTYSDPDFSEASAIPVGGVIVSQANDTLYLNSIAVQTTGLFVITLTMADDFDYQTDLDNFVFDMYYITAWV